MAQFKIRMISSLDISASSKEIKAQIPKLESELNSKPIKLKFELDMSSTKQLSEIKSQIANAFNGNELQSFNKTLNTTISETEKLTKNQVKIVDGTTKQIIDEINLGLGKTQKIINQMHEDGKTILSRTLINTNDYDKQEKGQEKVSQAIAKTTRLREEDRRKQEQLQASASNKVMDDSYLQKQNQLYKDMNDSINRIYSKKKDLIGADEQESNIINRTLQAEQQKLIVLNQEKSAGGFINQEKELNLTNQIKVKVEELVQAQGKSIDVENRKIQSQEQIIANYRKEVELQLQLDQKKYGSLIDSNDMTKVQTALNSLKVNPNLSNDIKGVKNTMKELETNAQSSSRALDLTAKSSMSLGSALKEAFSKFPKTYGEMVA